MLIDHEVDHIVKLARIELSPELRERMKKDLSAVLDYIALLEKADTSGVEPLYQVTGLQNQTRLDKHRGDWPMDKGLSDLLIEQAPHHEDRYLKVKSVKAK